MATTRMTQTQLVRTLAESCDVNNKVSRSMLDCLASTAISEVKKNGVFVLPGLGRLGMPSVSPPTVKLHIRGDRSSL